MRLAAEADHIRGLLSLRRGDRTAARALLRQAHAAAPDDVVIAGDLADLLRGDGDCGAALAVLPAVAATAAQRAALLLALGRAGESVALYRSLGPLEALPDLPRASAVVALAEAGEIDAAMALGVPLLEHRAPEIAPHVRAALVAGCQRADRWDDVLHLTAGTSATSTPELVFARVAGLIAAGSVADAVALHDAAAATHIARLRAEPGGEAALALETVLHTSDHFDAAEAVLQSRVLPDPDLLCRRDQRFDFARACAEGRVTVPDAQAYNDLCRRPAPYSYPLVLISAVRDEADIIDGMLAWHFAQGVDAAIVIDNGSVDGTRTRLADLSARWPILVIDQPAGTYNQVQWLTRMVRLAGALLGAEWVIPADADELWLPRQGDLKHALQRLTSGVMAGANQLQLGTELVVPDRARGSAAGFAPLDETLVVHQPLADFGYRYAEAEKRLTPYLSQWRKCWLKVADTRLVGMGNHYALMAAPRVGYGAAAVCRHYHTRSFAHFEAKARRDRQAAAGSDAHARRVFADQFAAFAAHAEAAAAAIYQRRSWPNPVYDYFLAEGRARHDPTVRDRLAACDLGHLKPLPAPAFEGLAERIAEIDRVLPALVG